MRYTLLISLYLCFTNVVAQHTFYYQHATPYINTIRDIIECEGGYLGVGESMGGARQGFLVMLDKSGNVLWDKANIYPPEGEGEYELYRTVIFQKEDNVFFVGGRRVKANSQRNVLLKVTTSGDILWSKTFGDSAILGGDNYLIDLHIDDGELIAATSKFDSVSMTTDANLVGLDFNGNVLWTKSYGTDISEEKRIDRFLNIDKMNDGWLLVLMSQSETTWRYIHTLIKLDNDRNEQWRKNMDIYQPTTVTYSDTLYFSDAAVYPDGKRIVGHFVRNLPSGNMHQVLVEFDEFGNEVEFVEYEEQDEVEDIKIYVNSESEIFVFGALIAPAPFYFELYTAKFDQNIHFLWETNYGFEQSNDMFKCGIPTSDGGVLISGTLFTTEFGLPTLNSLIYKTDCRGELDWSYQSCSFPETDKPLIFPNPSTGHFSVFIPDIQVLDEVTVELHNLMGEKVGVYQFSGDELLNINVQSHSAGLYTCRIFVNGTLTYVDKIVKI